MNTPLILSFLASALAIGYGAILIRWVISRPAGDEKMRSIAKAIQDGAGAYMLRQTKSAALVAAVVFVLLFFVIGKVTAVGFLVGAVL